MFIFHKTEVVTVILRCLTGLNLDWFKSYGLRCSLRLRACLANLKKIATNKWPFYDHIWLVMRLFTRTKSRIRQGPSVNILVDMISGLKNLQVIPSDLEGKNSTEGPCLMRLLGPGKIRISQKSH